MARMQPLMRRCEWSDNYATPGATRGPDRMISTWRSRTRREAMMAGQSNGSGNGQGSAAGRAELRSQAWFNNPDNPAMTALYLERYLNYGLTRKELQSGKPIIGIAQTGSDLSPCNRHHLDLADRVKEGIREAGGVPFEFPVHTIQETGKRPTAALDR